MNEYTRETVEAALKESNPVLEAMTLMLKELACETCAALEAILSLVGADPSQLPGEYLLQSILVQSDKVFKPIGREDWIKIWDSYHAIQEVLETNPDLHRHIVGAQDDTVSKLLDGNF